MLFFDGGLEICLLLLIKDLAPRSVAETRDVVVVGPDVRFYLLFPGGSDRIGFIAIPLAHS